MKINRSLFFVIIVALTTICCSTKDDLEPVLPQPIQTNIYLIRHSEKADASANPNLSSVGLQRANNWAIILKDVTFEAFYSTNYNRTLQTIQPLATKNDKEVTIYNPSSFSLQDVVAAYKGKNVFIVGHSNTVPPLINSYLGSTIYPNMEETEFGNLYKITIVDDKVSHEMTIYN
jgi:2,3-bisphosphoglycerate-dependent phosphoglycerate mutase